MRKLLWTPSITYKEGSSLARYQQYLFAKNNLSFDSYTALHQWSIRHIELFWESIVKFFPIRYSGTYSQVLLQQSADADFIGSKWFGGISLSYAEHIFADRNRDTLALIYADEQEEYRAVTWGELEQRVSRLQQFMRSKGIEQGDRVVGVLNNTIDTIAIFLAANSIGAIWSCCSPDFGDTSIAERFDLIEPKMLFIETSYQYNGKTFDKRNTIEYIRKKVSSIRHIIEVYGQQWEEIQQVFQPQELSFVRVAFDFPIWILYSSGTTGKPKAITHRTGGNLLEHFKALSFHQNVAADDRFLWYTTTGWMMWNYALSSLLCGAVLCLYNGAITFKEHKQFWNFVRRSRVNHLGAGAAYFASTHDLQIENVSLKVIGSTGSPLPDETFRNLQAKFPGTHIISLSGGTDVCSAFLSGCPLLPVYEGEIQCRTLGSDIVAYNDRGEEIYGGVGELVIKQPMPSMPLYFWKDPGNMKYKESYFEGFSGVWNHGDWIVIQQDGGIRMFGRSDATLNRGGVRIGTAEIYNAVQTVANVLDSLVITTDETNGASKMILFLKLQDHVCFEETVRSIQVALREQYSARHIPDRYFEVSDIPYTLSGKKLEIPIKKIFSGISVEQAVSTDIMRNPESLVDFVNLYTHILENNT
ncbi:acetoacetate--CoA ligase [Sphingobacterium suaedae]|uniref:Acetoacetate--CoA ligase n=1 Tax=Sphingobacterium suaedae TaxID=1686402 RepID=A0ABW5KC85_9SPHI